jgi:hypothetical protein
LTAAAAIGLPLMKPSAGINRNRRASATISGPPEKGGVDVWQESRSRLCGFFL